MAEQPGSFEFYINQGKYAGLTGDKLVKFANDRMERAEQNRIEEEKNKRDAEIQAAKNKKDTEMQEEKIKREIALQREKIQMEIERDLKLKKLDLETRTDMEQELDSHTEKLGLKPIHKKSEIESNNLIINKKPIVKCNNCNREFESRNKLFVHLNNEVCHKIDTLNTLEDTSLKRKDNDHTPVINSDQQNDNSILRQIVQDQSRQIQTLIKSLETLTSKFEKFEKSITADVTDSYTILHEQSSTIKKIIMKIADSQLTDTNNNQVNLNKTSISKTTSETETQTDAPLIKKIHSISKTAESFCSVSTDTTKQNRNKIDSTTQYRDKPMCFFCKDFGHKANRCTLKLKNITCYTCKNLGHKQSFCPFKTRDIETHKTNIRHKYQPQDNNFRNRHTHNYHSNRNTHKSVNNYQTIRYKRSRSRKYCDVPTCTFCKKISHLKENCFKLKNSCCLKCKMKGHTQSRCKSFSENQKFKQIHKHDANKCHGFYKENTCSLEEPGKPDISSRLNHK